jgi:hypothetical protein
MGWQMYGSSTSTSGLLKQKQKKTKKSLNTLGNHTFTAFTSIAVWDMMKGLFPMSNTLEQRDL